MLAEAPFWPHSLINCKKIYHTHSLSPIEPAGTIMSNAVDMAKWMRFILHNGTTDSGESLINSDRIDEMFQVSVSFVGVVIIQFLTFGS